jgi:energy-coupling factor transporter ATP-binding protein EcfA2
MGSGHQVEGEGKETHETAPLSLSQEIVSWSEDRPDWQRDALRRLATAPLSDGDLAELAVLCAGPPADTSSDLEAQPLQLADLPPDGRTNPTGHLGAIRDCVDIDALAPGQQLDFSPAGLTVVYGDNGSGKSSYIRLLRQFAQGAGQKPSIHGNVFTEAVEQQQAQIDFYDGAQQQSYIWPIEGDPPEALRSVRVFDAASVPALVERGTEVTYEPGGLHLLSELHDACKRVEKLLRDERAGLSQAFNEAADLLRSLEGDHEVGALFAELEKPEALQGLRELAVAEDIAEKLGAAKERLAALRPTDPERAAKRLRLDAAKPRGLAHRFDKLAAQLDDSAVAESERRAGAVRMTRQAAIEAAGVLEGDVLPGTGSDAWRALWDAAREFSEAHAYPDHAFPAEVDDARCVLCQQQLDPDGRRRLDEFERFVKDAVQAKADAVAREAKALLDTVDGLVIEEEADATLREDPILEAGALGERTAAEIANFRARRATILSVLCAAVQDQAAAELPEMEPLDAGLPDELRELEKSLTEQAEKVLSPVDGESEVLQAEIAGLAAHEQLRALLPKVEQQRARLVRIAEIDEALEASSSGAITRKHRELMDKVVTERLIERFDMERGRLGLDLLQIRMKSSGRAGETKCQVEILDPRRPVKVERMLSDGERRGVALAALLAELAVIGDNCPLVIDDPVSSLDHRIRERLAIRLADEASRRQVIVFTHDAVFMFLLEEAARAKTSDGVETSEHQIVRIQRSADGAGCPGELGWGPSASAGQRAKALRQRLHETKKFYAAQDEAVWERAAKEIAAGLREAWERAVEECLFADVIQRFDRGVSTQKLKQVKFRVEDVHEIEKQMTVLSRWVHDQARPMTLTVPTAPELNEQIEALHNWLKEVGDRPSVVKAAASSGRSADRRGT